MYTHIYIYICYIYIYIFHPVRSLRTLNLFSSNQLALYKMCIHYVKNKKSVECSHSTIMSNDTHIHFDNKVLCKDNHCDSGKEITTQSAANQELSWACRVLRIRAVCVVHSSRSPSFLNQLCSDRNEREEGAHSDIPVSNALWHPIHLTKQFKKHPWSDQSLTSFIHSTVHSCVVRYHPYIRTKENEVQKADPKSKIESKNWF